MIQAQLTDRFAQTLIQAQNLQSSHLDVLKRHLGAVEKSLVEISPSKDQDLFIEYNIRPFTVPADLKFEPCSNFYDAVSNVTVGRASADSNQDNMSVEPAPKVFIQNRLAKSQQKLKELNPIISNKSVFESSTVSIRLKHRQLVNLINYQASYKPTQPTVP